MYHRTDIGTIEGAILHGLGQKALDLIPLLDPWTEPNYPPTWWYNYDSANNWRAHLNSRRIPDTWLIDQWLRYCWRMVGFYAEEVGPWARDTAQTWARNVLGYALYNWNTFSNWIDNIGTRLGIGMVTWANNAFDGLQKAYLWLPPEIRTNLQSWNTLLTNWKQKAIDWVIATYHASIALGLLAWNWVLEIGNKIKPWWEAVRNTVNEFVANPTGFIIGRLGWYWNKLVGFVDRYQDWYTALKDQYGLDLAAFLADPPAWIWDRVEAYIIRRW